MGAQPKAWVCSRSSAEIVGSNPAGGMDIFLLWVLCVVRRRSLRLPYYRVLLSVMCRGDEAQEKKICVCVYVYIYIYTQGPPKKMYTHFNERKLYVV